MPIAGLGLHVLIAIFFATYAIRSGQEWDRCRALVDEGNRISKRMPGASRDINREWIARLKKVESALPGPA